MTKLKVQREKIVKVGWGSIIQIINVNFQNTEIHNQVITQPKNEQKVNMRIKYNHLVIFKIIRGVLTISKIVEIGAGLNVHLAFVSMGHTFIF